MGSAALSCCCDDTYAEEIVGAFMVGVVEPEPIGDFSGELVGPSASGGNHSSEGARIDEMSL